MCAGKPGACLVVAALGSAVVGASDCEKQGLVCKLRELQAGRLEAELVVLGGHGRVAWEGSAAKLFPALQEHAGSIRFSTAWWFPTYHVLANRAARLKGRC